MWESMVVSKPDGVRHDSVLGPTFFVVFINDIPDSINSTVKIFADDTKLFRSVTSDEEHVVLQSDLDMLADWSETWQLKFNASKCKVLHIGQHDTNYEYYTWVTATWRTQRWSSWRICACFFSRMQLLLKGTSSPHVV